ncbi:DnaA/Hda family protein [Acidimicrobiia bacterium]|nr:DnaA/Hda family protein [Acidimicrobiia bacterium]
MNQDLQIFRQKISQEEFSKTETYWLDQIDFQIVDGDLNICINSEFVKSSIEKKIYKKLLSISEKISGIHNCIFVLDPSIKLKKVDIQTITDSYPEKPINDKEEKVFEVDLSVFNNLLTGSSNNLAITAAKNVVQNPGSRFNPLFIHGKPGVGKTHLLKTMEESSRSSYYIDSESFLESYVSGIKNQSIDLFKNKIRSVDILLIDDIQFFMGKKGVSEELFHTINYFLNNNKAVVLVSDQKPQDLLGFPERLISRILNGLVTDIEQPSSEMFKEFLTKTNEENDNNLLTFSNIEDLSNIDISSFRDINGIVNSLVLNKQTGVNNSDYITGLVKNLLNKNTFILTPEYLFDYVSSLHQIDKKLIASKNRSLEVSAARHLLVVLMRKHTDLSLTQIGLYLGNRSHSTVLSYLKKGKNSAVVLKEVNSFDNKLNMVEAS